MKTLLYLTGLSSFIVSIWFLISFQSSVYVSNISLFMSVKAKIKDLSFFNKVYIYVIKSKIKRIFTINIYLIKTFHCDIFNVVNSNISTFFKRYLVYTQHIWNKIFDINHFMKKVICTIFRINFFEIYHLFV